MSACDDEIHATFARFAEAEARSTELMKTGRTGQLLAEYGLDDQALRTWAQHVERNAIQDASLGGAFVGGFLLALCLAERRGR